MATSKLNETGLAQVWEKACETFAFKRDAQLEPGISIGDSLSKLDENISNEIDRATNKEDEIESALNSEITRAKNAENTLETNKVPITRTINGKALSSDITLSASDVGADASGSANTALTNAKAYTDTKVADLVGTAPETLDTLEELADALKDNADIVDVLNESITSKASAVDLTSHTGNTTVHITANERAAWNDKVSKTTLTDANLDVVVTTGFYRLGENDGLPASTCKYGQLIVSRGGDTASQICMSYSTGRIFTRSCNISDTERNWTEWAEIYTTAMPPANVATADKLSTARKIGKASFDGSGDVSLADIMGRAETTSSVGHAGHYTKFATIDVSAVGWICCAGTLEFLRIEAPTVVGRLHYTFRSQSSITDTYISLYWETISDIKYAETVIATKVSDGVFDLYYKPLAGYDSMTITSTNTGTNSNNPELLTLYSQQEYVESLENIVCVSKISAMATKLTTPAGTAMSSGTATQPVYFSDGVPVACTYTLGASVPSGAKFTDTVYTHPTTSGNKHIPSGGSSGQILRWSADGTAVWGADNNTTYSVVSTTADGLAPKRDGSTTKYLRADGTWAVPPDTNTTYTSLKNPYSLTIQGNGTTLTNGTYDGSVAKTVNITPSSIGAAASSHGTHVTYGTSASALGTSSAGSAATVSRSDHVHALPALTSCTGTLTVAKGGTGATDAATARTNLGITPANIGAAVSSHTHGLLNSSLGVEIQDTTTDNGWSMINTNYTNGFILKAIRTNKNAPNWIESNYAAGIAFGGGDTKGVLSVAYNAPYIRFAGGNGTKPAWWLKLSGTSGKTYNLDNFSASSHTHKYAGSSSAGGAATTALACTGNSATATKLATARTISLTGSVTGSGSFDGSGNLSIATTTNHAHNYLPLSGGTLTGTLNTQNLLPSGNYSVGNASYPYNYGYFKNAMSNYFGILDSNNTSQAGLSFSTSTDVMYYSGTTPFNDVVGLSISTAIYYNMRLSSSKIYLNASSRISSSVAIVMASDEKVKSFTEDIDTDEEKLVKLFDIIKPKSYNYRYSKSDSLNVGFSAQEIEQAMIDLDIDPEKYGILNIQYGHMLSRGNDFEDGKYYTKFYEISYNDLFNLSLLKTHMMEKEHVERLAALEEKASKLDELEARLSALENK